MGSCSSIQNTASVYVVATIFNPCNFRSRTELYRRFAQSIRFPLVRLITVECIFAGQSYQVTQSNNADHIQLYSEDIFWLKENMINLAAQRLIALSHGRCEYIVWADADLLFSDPSWVQKTIDALRLNKVVQVFETCDFLGPDGRVLRTDYSLGYSHVHNKPIDQSRYGEHYPHPGFAWAMRLVDFLDMGGLFEPSLVGSADLHFAFAILPGNRVLETLPSDISIEYKNSLIEWSQRVARTIREQVGYVPIQLRHLWHGDRENRQYMTRWSILTLHRWDPRMLVRDHRTGLLRFDPAYKTQLAPLRAAVLAYFRKREEDDKVVKSARAAQSIVTTASSSMRLGTSNMNHGQMKTPWMVSAPKSGLSTINRDGMPFHAPVDISPMSVIHQDEEDHCRHNQDDHTHHHTHHHHHSHHQHDTHHESCAPPHHEEHTHQTYQQPQNVEIYQNVVVVESGFNPTYPQY